MRLLSTKVSRASCVIRQAPSGFVAPIWPERRRRYTDCSCSPKSAPPATWALEPKLDGWRALFYIEDGRIDVRTRRGRSITERVPELAGLADQGHAGVRRHCQ